MSYLVFFLCQLQSLTLPVICITYTENLSVFFVTLSFYPISPQNLICAAANKLSVSILNHLFCKTTPVFFTFLETIFRNFPCKVSSLQSDNLASFFWFLTTFGPLVSLSPTITLAAINNTSSLLPTKDINFMAITVILDLLRVNLY